MSATFVPGNLNELLMCFDFARSLADRFVVMDRGEAVLSGDAATMVEDDVRRRIAV